jgi:WD40 repeat protein
MSRVLLSRDGAFLTSGSYDHCIKLWDLKTGREWNALTAHREQVCAVTFVGDGKVLASADIDGTMLVGPGPW